jgi:hypothetical protein
MYTASTLDEDDIESPNKLRDAPSVKMIRDDMHGHSRTCMNTRKKTSKQACEWHQHQMRNAIATRLKQHLRNKDVSTRTAIGSCCEVVVNNTKSKTNKKTTLCRLARIGLVGRPNVTLSSATKLPCPLREIISWAT